MHKKNLKTIILILFTFQYCIAQDVAIDPAFFTTKNMRLGISLGADFSPNLESNEKYSLLYTNAGSTNSSISYNKSSANTSFNLGLDLYSPSSILGFFTEVNFNSFTYLVENGSISDEIKSLNIEIPMYFRFRLGKVNRATHTWLGLGGGYSIFSKGQQNKVEDKNFLKSIPFLSGILGYEIIVAAEGKNGKEIYNRDSFRGLLYLKVNYDLDSRINESYTFNRASALGNLSDPNLKFMRVSVGIKLLFKLSSFGKMAVDSLK